VARLPSTVVIRYRGTDITAHVMPATARFESQMSAAPGSFEITVRDRDQSLSFVSGGEIELDIDGVPMFGGFVTNIRRKYAFPAVDTSNPAAVKSRLWVLTGVDYNILFDKRVIRNPADYLHQLPNFTSEDFDGDLIREALAGSRYIDVPAGFDTDSQVENTDAYRTYNSRTNGAISSGATTVTVDDVDNLPATFPFQAIIKDDPTTFANREIVSITGRTGLVFDIVRAQGGSSAIAHGDNSFLLHKSPGAWPQQGSLWRQLMEDFTQFSGAGYYLAANKVLHHHALESLEARWGFSDRPNKDPITASPVAYQGATYGPRELDAVQDGEVIINDALVWGGSEWAGAAGGTVFARRQNTPSQDDHGRWQTGEVHIGEEGFKTSKGVAARAKVIVDGGATVGGGFNPGLAFEQWNVSLTWFAHDVPFLSGVRDHLRAGQLVHIELQTFAVDDIPLEHILPMRSLSVTFPATKGPNEADDKESYVQFDGTFGLQLSDPFTLWRYLLRATKLGKANQVVSAVDGTNPAPYGSVLAVEPEPPTDSTTTTFHLPDGRGYIGGTTEVYLTGSRLRRGVDYTESDPINGVIEMTNPPDGADWLWIVCRTT